MKNNKMGHELSPTFISDLRATCETKSRLPPKFLADLNYIFETDPSEDVSVEDLERLESELQEWGRRCDRELNEELANLPENHPIKCPISLLGIRGCGRLEVAHTRTLAWLLNPRESHGFGKAMLDVLLRSFQGGRKLVAFDVREVDAERFYRNSDGADAGRTDIWIELTWRNPTGMKPRLVVIEAKVDASEGDEQLSRYNKAIKEWLAEHRSTGSTVWRIFLTRTAEEAETGKGWMQLSFSSLARIFWGTSNSLATTPGYHVLRFYLAGVLKDILDLPIGLGNVQWNRHKYKLLGFLKGS
jgi:hypothetical protein